MKILKRDSEHRPNGVTIESVLVDGDGDAFIATCGEVAEALGLPKKLYSAWSCSNHSKGGTVALYRWTRNTDPDYTELSQDTQDVIRGLKAGGKLHKLETGPLDYRMDFPKGDYWFLGISVVSELTEAGFIKIEGRR